MRRQWVPRPETKPEDSALLQLELMVQWMKDVVELLKTRA